MDELTYKQKKGLVIATWLNLAQVKLGKQSVRDVYSLVHSLIVDQHTNDDIHFNACEWSLEDCYLIASESRLDGVPIDRCAVAISPGSTQMSVNKLC